MKIAKLFYKNYFNIKNEFTSLKYQVQSDERSGRSSFLMVIWSHTYCFHLQQQHSAIQAEREKNVKAIICCKIIEITDYYKRALESRLINIPDKMINYRFLVLLETLIILFSM